MLTPPRTFRLTAASMVVLLLLSGCLPLVQHVCAMANRHAPAQNHPCPNHEHDEAPIPQSMHAHGSMHAGSMHHASMHTPPQADPPCDHEATPQATPADCCVVDTAPGVAPDGVRLLKRSMKPDVAPATALADASPKYDGDLSDARFFDVRPPPEASTALHLVHSVLLN